MDYLGYSREFDNISLRDITNFEEDAALIVGWLKRYKLTVSEQELKEEVVRQICFLMEEPTMENIVSYAHIESATYSTLKREFRQ